VTGVLLAGCATTPGGAPDAPRVGGGSERAPVPASDAPFVRLEDGFDEEVLYKLLVAEFAGQRGHLDTAVTNYLDVARLTRAPEMAKRAATIAVFARNDEAALEASRIWAVADPDDLEARQITAAMHIRAGQVEEALAQLEYVLSADEGDSGEKLRMIANFLSRERDKRTALDVMERLVEQRDGDPDALLAYAMLAIRAQELDHAREAMDRVVSMTEVNATIAMSYLDVLHKQDEVETAINWMARVVERQPEAFDLRLLYARLLADSQLYEEARIQFGLLAENSPDNDDIAFALALLNLQAGRVDDAEAGFNLVNTRDVERSDQASFYLGQIGESRGDSAAALEHYREMQGGNNYFHAQLRIAFILSERGEVDEARAQLQSVIPESDFERSRLVRAEGEILTDHGRFEDAMALYDAMLAERFDADLLYMRAMLAERLDRLDQLEADLRLILDKEPENAQALNALGYTLADRTERYDEALELIERALAISEDDFYVLDSMGWVLYRLGRLQESVEYLQRARAIRNDPEVAAHLGEVLWVMGDRDAAREILEAALETSPESEILLDVIQRLQQ
ncbi:MAG: tetratricopeptide repeat protein, partial [Gammaproteobacteria bacterium]|nr:tetratricopeptide repeat protein [Gammaproteobacteria bacterium]